MSITSHARIRFALLLGTGLASVLASGESRAYTAEQQQACTPDAFRLCSSEIPDVDRVTACMVRNKSQLSPQCRAFFRPGPEPREDAADATGRPLSIRPAAAEKVRAHRIKRPRPDDT
ncbi:MAG TPA: hypothetical protein VKY22_01705 [Bradyrhizobium sp.]|nr:hypothetical protein [Bradyrhizobium sp.]